MVQSTYNAAYIQIYGSNPKNILEVWRVEEAGPEESQEEASE